MKYIVMILILTGCNYHSHRTFFYCYKNNKFTMATEIEAFDKGECDYIDRDTVEVR